MSSSSISPQTMQHNVESVAVVTADTVGGRGDSVCGTIISVTGDAVDGDTQDVTIRHQNRYHTS